MPTDIFIATKEGQTMALESEDGTTIADIIRNLGPGSLRREDGATKLSPSLVIQAGKYSWIPAQVPTMRDTEQHGKKLNRFGSFVYC